MRLGLAAAFVGIWCSGLLLGLGSGMFAGRDYLAPERVKTEAKADKLPDRLDSAQLDSSGAPGPKLLEKPSPVIIAMDAQSAVYATTRNDKFGPEIPITIGGFGVTLLARRDEAGNYRLECVLP